MLLIAGITLLRIKKHKYMIYAFRVTAKQNIGGSKGIAKGMSVQIKKEGGSPGVNDVLALSRGSQLNCVRGIFPLGINLGRRDAIFNHVSTTRSPRQRKVT